MTEPLRRRIVRVLCGFGPLFVHLGALCLDKSLPSGSSCWAWGCDPRRWDSARTHLFRDRGGINVLTVRSVCRGRPARPVGYVSSPTATALSNTHTYTHCTTSLGLVLEDKRWGTKGEGGDMMDDRGEHCGRRTHSSVGGIYRSNRTVSTCPCHLLESVGVGACLRILTCVHWVVFPQPSEMSGWECFVSKYSLAVYGKACFLLRFSLAIYDV